MDTADVAVYIWTCVAPPTSTPPTHLHSLTSLPQTMDTADHSVRPAVRQCLEGHTHQSSAQLSQHQTGARGVVSDILEEFNTQDVMLIRAQLSPERKKDIKDIATKFYQNLPGLVNFVQQHKCTVVLHLQSLKRNTKR